MSDIGNKLWRFCHTLRHDGIDYGDYIEQLTYLLFLKMADEKGIEINPEYNWNSLIERSGSDLLDHYTKVLQTLKTSEGIFDDRLQMVDGTHQRGTQKEGCAAD